MKYNDFEEADPCGEFETLENSNAQNLSSSQIIALTKTEKIPMLKSALREAAETESQEKEATKINLQQNNFALFAFKENTKNIERHANNALDAVNFLLPLYLVLQSREPIFFGSRFPHVFHHFKNVQHHLSKHYINTPHSFAQEAIIPKTAGEIKNEIVKLELSFAAALLKVKEFEDDIEMGRQLLEFVKDALENVKKLI